MKKYFLKVIIGLIFIIAFNVLFFVLGGVERTTTEWISYGFIHVAYFCLLFTPFLYKVNKSQFILYASLYLRALFYFFIEFVIGLGFIIYNPDSILIPCIIQTVLLVGFIIMQVMSVLANDSTKLSLSKQNRENFYIQSLAENLKNAMRQVNDPIVKKEIANCYELLKSSSIESFPQAKDVELELQNAVDALCSSIQKGDTIVINKHIRQIYDGMNNRNRIIKIARLS